MRADRLSPRLPPYTRKLIARSAAGGRIVAAVMLDVFAQLDEQGVELERAVELAGIAAARCEVTR